MKTSGVFALCVVSVMLSGCGGTVEQSVDVPENPPVGGIQTYSLPLDDFIYSRVSRTIGEYAESLLVEVCMNSRGYEWPIARRDVETLELSPVRSESGRRLFSIEIAESFGYHEPETLPPDVVAADRALATLITTPDMEAAIETCIVDEARTELPIPGTEIQQGAILANQALQSAFGDPAVVEAARLWRECMAPMGVSDLPAAPDGEDAMPSPSLQLKFGLGDPDSVPSVDEIELATADASCRESSGYAQALYDAEWRLQRDALLENADTLTSHRAEIERYVSEARRVINEYGS